MWLFGRNLKRLALYNVDASSHGFVRDIERCRNVTIVKIGVPVPPGRVLENTQLYHEWVRDVTVQGSLWNSKGALLSVKAVAGLIEGRPGFTIRWQVSDSPSLDFTPDFDSGPGMQDWLCYT